MINSALLILQSRSMVATWCSGYGPGVLQTEPRAAPYHPAEQVQDTPHCLPDHRKEYTWSWFERFGSVENTSWCPPPQLPLKVLELSLMQSGSWLFWLSSGTCSGPGHDSCSRGTSRMRTPVSWACPQPSSSISRTILPILPNTMMKENIIEFSFYAGIFVRHSQPCTGPSELQGCWAMPHHAGVGDLNSN